MFTSSVYSNRFIPLQPVPVPDGKHYTEGSIRFSVFEIKKIFVRKNGKEEEIFFDPLQHVQQPMIERIVEYFSGKEITRKDCQLFIFVHLLYISDQNRTTAASNKDLIFKCFLKWHTVSLQMLCSEITLKSPGATC